ncbi:hypothetical protein ABZ929_28820 [Streptomyces physcomitrii]|uniref:hypothetical protein n=1 Tax=Streptomyces physcomitrii TaxID=2724184 RepID=UPI0034319DFC
MARLKSFGFGLAVFLGAVAVIAALVLGPGRVADSWWREVAPHWPGGGYGFTVSAGLLSPLAPSLAAWALFGTDFKRHRARSVGLVALSLPAVAATVMFFAIAAQSWPPKGRRSSCGAYDTYCWIDAHYPWAWLVGGSSAVLGMYLFGQVGGLWRRTRGRLAKTTGPAAEASGENGAGDPAPAASDQREGRQP